MITRTLVALALLVFCSTSVSAQDLEVFLSFTQGSDANTGTASVSDGSGTAFLYLSNNSGLESLEPSGLDNFDLEFTNSDDAVIQFTAATLLNPSLPFGGIRLNPGSVAELCSDDSMICSDDSRTGRIAGVAFFEEGIRSVFADVAFDATFDDTIGANGAFLIAEIDYDIVGTGTTVLSLNEGEEGFLSFASPEDFLDVNLRGGSLTVANAIAIPEPGSAAILALGLMGLLTRRQRS